MRLVDDVKVWLVVFKDDSIQVDLRQIHPDHLPRLVVSTYFTCLLMRLLLLCHDALSELEAANLNRRCECVIIKVVRWARQGSHMTECHGHHIEGVEVNV